MSEVLVIDEITAKQGQARVLIDRYMADYVPAAQKRGMVLRRTLIEPALELRHGDHGNTVSFIWSVEGAAGWWNMRISGSFDPAVSTFWTSIEPLVERRSRTFHQDAEHHV